MRVDRPSVFALLLPLVFGPLNSAAAQARGAGVKEVFAFVISTCLRETRNSCLVLACVFSVCLCLRRTSYH